MKQEFKFVYDKPEPSEYIQIRSESGFGKISLSQSERSLDNSLFIVSVYQTKKLIGIGRIVGDGVLYFYISDVLISPDIKGKGVGGRIMEELISYLNKTANPLSTISLLAAPNKEDFYTKYGFELCPNEYFGKGLSYTKLVKL